MTLIKLEANKDDPIVIIGKLYVDYKFFSVETLLQGHDNVQTLPGHGESAPQLSCNSLWCPQ